MKPVIVSTLWWLISMIICDPHKSPAFSESSSFSGKREGLVKLNSMIFFQVLFYFLNLLGMPHSMWDFSFLTRVRICAPCTKSLNHWTTREVPHWSLKFLQMLSSELGPGEMPLRGLNAPPTEHSKHTGHSPGPDLCSNWWFEPTDPCQRAWGGKWFSGNHTSHPRAFAHAHPLLGTLVTFHFLPVNFHLGFKS